jgi:hypothetical protein
MTNLITAHRPLIIFGSTAITVELGTVEAVRRCGGTGDPMVEEVLAGFGHVQPEGPLKNN